jgi:hypothetical protein
VQDPPFRATQNGGSARDYLPGFAWFGAFVMGPTRERLSVCLFIGALGVNFRICRRPGDDLRHPQVPGRGHDAVLSVQ